MVIPDTDNVVVSWIGYNGVRREQVMTVEQARLQWERLPQPYRETYTIRREKWKTVC